MMDKKTFFAQLFTPGTVPCTLLGAGIGLLFAILCMTIGIGRTLVVGLFCLVGAFIGGVKDKKAFIANIVFFFRRDENGYE